MNPRAPLCRSSLALAAIVASLTSLAAPVLSATPAPAPAAAPAKSPAPAHTLSQPVVGANTLPSMSANGFGRVGTHAAGDTFLVRSSSFDVASTGLCDPRGWATEDRVTRVYAHVSDQYVVNRRFAGTNVLESLNLPNTIDGTSISGTSGLLSIPDSNLVLYIESPFSTGRLIAVYPGQNVIRQYAAPFFTPGGVTPSLAWDPTTGDVIYGTTNGFSGRLYRIPVGSGPFSQGTLIAGNDFGSPADTIDTEVKLGLAIRSVDVDHDGNIYFHELVPDRIRMWRANDHRIVTIAGGGTDDQGDGGPAVGAGIRAVGQILLSPDDHDLYLCSDIYARLRKIDLTTGIIDQVPGAAPADFAAFDPIGGPDRMIFVGGVLHIAFSRFTTDVGKIVELQGGSLTQIAGTENPFGPPSLANRGLQQELSGFTGIERAPDGGFYFTQAGRHAIYHQAPSGAMSVVVGRSFGVEMGQRALWFGADEQSAPDEVANWVQQRGYGNGWSQRLTSPSIPVNGEFFEVSLDAYVHLSPDSTGVADGAAASHVRVQHLDDLGEWVEMQAISEDPLVSVYGVSGTGVVHVRYLIGKVGIGAETRVRVVCNTLRQVSNEDGRWHDDQPGAAIVDNIRIQDFNHADITPPLDFEDGTTGVWELSALNAPNAVNYAGFGSTRVLEYPPPQTNIALRTGFDFSDASCAWTFLSPTDSIASNGVFARLTSPWIATINPSDSLYVSWSGKLPTHDMRRVLAISVRTKNAGDTRIRGLFYSANAFNSGTRGLVDLSSPYQKDRFIRIPRDLESPASWSPVDSIQVVLQIEDRDHEMFTEGNDFGRGPSRLPYLDDIRIYERVADADADGVADLIDACPAVSSVGQDADGDGCPDPTATLRHVETWQNASRPIHYAFAAAGDPHISDGSDLQAIRDAIAAWQAVPGASVPMVEDAPSANSNANLADGINLITFEDELAFPPDVIAVTPTTSFIGRSAFDDQIVLPGQIVDSDLIFNPLLSYRTATAGGGPESVDLRSVATHEIGHMLGISHSGVAEATMYPIIQDGEGAASLEDDDRAAIAAAYPGATFATAFGTITGTVVRGSNGNPIPGALVTAWLLDGTNVPIRAVSSNYSDENGAYALRRLPDGNYGVRIDPLDGSIPGVVPAAINDRVRGIAQTNFLGEWWSTPVEDGTEDPELKSPIAVSAGVTASGIQLVTPKDVTPPAIVSVLPGDGAGDVSIDGRVLINFSEPVDPGTLGAAFALRKTGESGRLGGSAQILDFNRTFIFTPTSPLEFGTAYEIELTTALTDREGVPLAATFLSHFQTPTPPDVAIFDIQPRQGPFGTLITIRGQGFEGPSLSVEYPTTFGPVQLFGPGGTRNTLVTLIQNEQQSGPIRVHSNGQVSNAFNFTVTAPFAGSPQPSGSPVPLSFSPSDVAVSPEGANVFAVGNGGFATVNLSPARPHFRVEELEAILGLAHISLSPDGLRAYVTRPDHNEVLEVVTDTTSAGFGHAYVTIPMPGAPDGIYVTPDGMTAYVSEAAGSHIWQLNVDPTDPQFRGVVREIDVEGVTLTGGLSVSSFTDFAAPQRIGSEYRPPTPRTHADTYHFLNATSAQGLIQYDLETIPGDPLFEIKNPKPMDGSIVTSLNGAVMLGAGAGPAADQVVGACLGFCGDSRDATLGGRVRDLAISPEGGVLVVNSVFSQLQVLNQGTLAIVAVARTGSGPVAVATSGNGAAIAVANAGDRSISLFDRASSITLNYVSPDVGMPGDFGVLQAVDAFPELLDHAEIGNTNVSPTIARNRGMSFVVPDQSQGRTTIALVQNGARTPTRPYTIVDHISSFHPSFAGIDHAGCVGCGSRGRYVALRPSPDGRYLGAVRWPSVTPPTFELFELRGDAEQPYFSLLNTVSMADEFSDAAYTPDGLSLWSGGLSLTRYDVDPASPTFGASTVVPGDGQVLAIAADPVRYRMAASFIGNGVRIYAIDGSPSDLNPTTPSYVTSVQFSPDGRFLVAGALGQALFIDAGTYETLVTSPASARASYVERIAITSDSRRAVGRYLDGTISVWSLEPDHVGEELYYGNPLPDGLHVMEMTPAPDGTGVIAGTGAGMFHIDPRTTTPAVVGVDVGRPSPYLARSLDGRHLFASVTNDAQGDTLRIYTLSEGSQLSVVTGDGQEAGVSEPLPLPIRIHLADANGRPQYGALVRFALADDTHGELSGTDPLTATRLTDANGDAEIRWTMPGVTGAVTLTVTAPGLPMAPLAVHATVLGDPASAAPEIVAFGPPNGTIGLSATSEVFVRMSQAMDSTSAAEHFRLRVGSSPIPGAYRLSDDGRTVFFRPTEPLPYLTQATLEVLEGMLDTEGQPVVTGDTVSFTVQEEPALAIASLSPPAGGAGTEVTLNGAGFGSVAAQNTVRFNGVLAAVVAASTRSLVVRVPPTATTGGVTVQVASATSPGFPFVVLEPDTGGAVADTIKSHSSPIALVLTPDGSRVYVTSARTNTVGAIDIRTARELKVIPVGANPRAIAMLPDGSRAYTANYDSGDLTVIGTDPDSADLYNQAIGTIKVGKHPIAVVVRRQGPQLVVVNAGDTSVSIIDAQRGNSTFDQVIKNIPLPSNGGNIVIDPDGTRAFVVTGQGISVLDLESFVIKNIPLPSNGGNISISPDGGLLYLVGNDQRLYVIDVSIGTEYRVIKNIPLPGNGGNITIAPDGTRIFVTLPDGNVILVFDVNKGTDNPNGSSVPGTAVDLVLRATIPVGEAPSAVAADPLGRYVLVTNQGSDDLTLIVTESLPPQVVVEFPNGGETLVPGAVTTLVWDTDLIPNGQSADLEISRNLGLAWEPIANGVANTGAYDWLVTGPQTVTGTKPSFTALFRVTVHNVFDQSSSDVSDEPFTIFDGITPTLIVLFGAEARDDGIHVRWRLADPDRFTPLTIERAEAAAGPWAALAVTPLREGENTVITDNGARPGRTYFYRLVGREDGRPVILGTLEGTLMPVKEFALQAVGPNPALGRVGIDYAVASAARVRLDVIDIAGRRVATLVDGIQPAGLHRAVWSGETPNGTSPAGLYFVRYQAAGKTFTKRITFMR